MSPISPSRVGGVYLGGAGASLDELRAIEGIQVDTNNDLVLIAATGKTPPLRIDDVVNVFRSVCLYGEGPTVTIDPASKDPEKSAMIIRHGKATEDTYVGWVLYQAPAAVPNASMPTTQAARPIPRPTAATFVGRTREALLNLKSVIFALISPSRQHPSGSGGGGWTTGPDGPAVPAFPDSAQLAGCWQR